MDACTKMDNALIVSKRVQEILFSHVENDDTVEIQFLVNIRDGGIREAKLCVSESIKPKNIANVTK